MKARQPTYKEMKSFSCEKYSLSGNEVLQSLAMLEVPDLGRVQVIIQGSGDGVISGRLRLWTKERLQTGGVSWTLNRGAGSFRVIGVKLVLFRPSSSSPTHAIIIQVSPDYFGETESGNDRLDYAYRGYGKKGILNAQEIYNV